MPTAMAPTLALLTLRDVARMLRLSELSIYRLVRKRLLPCYRVMRRLRFKHADVERFLETRAANVPDHGGA